MNFKLKHIAVGTKGIPVTQSEAILGLGDYVETSIEYNNDFLIGKYIPKEAGLITRIYDTDNCEFLLKNHLGYLGRTYTDITLMSSSSLPDQENFEYLRDNSKNLGIFGDSMGPEDIEEYKTKYGIYPDYISIPLNPYYFKKDLIEKAQECEIKIISHEILGGPLEAAKMIKTFSLSFLTRFAAYYSDIICISGTANLEKEFILVKTLTDIIENPEVHDGSIYELNQQVIKIPEGAQRKVFTYSEVSISGKNHTFRIDHDDYISSGELMISFDNNLELYSRLDMEDIKKSDNIYMSTALVMKEIDKTEAPKKKEEVAPYYRYLVMNALDLCYPRWRYKFTLAMSGHVLRVTIKDRFMPWSKDLEFVLVISERLDGGYNVFFRNL